MVMEPNALPLKAKPVATTFECFPELPEELRLQIWSASMFARVVNIIYDQLKDKFISFNSTVPAILHTCRESRAFALKVDTLKLSFGTRTCSPRIYFDFAKDILFFDDWNASAQAGYLNFKFFRSTYIRPYGGCIYPEGDMNRNEVSKIERLAVNFEYIQEHGSRPEVAALLTRFEKMRTLFVVLESPCLDPTVYRFREAIEFIDVPAKTGCELEIERQKYANVYWNADQGGMKMVRGIHGMLEFSGNKAITRVMRSTRSIIDGRDQSKLSIIRGQHGMLKFEGGKAWIKIVRSIQDSDKKAVRKLRPRIRWTIPWNSRRDDQASSESDEEPLSESESDESKSEKCDICLQKETLEDSLLDVEGNVFDRMCVFDQMCQAADLWPQDDSDDSDEGSDDSQETDESANEPLVLEDINPGKEADDAASEFYEPDRPFKRVSDVEIKVVTAFRGHAHQSDFGCIKIPAFQDTNHGSESESGSHSEYGTECGSDCGSDINCYHNPAFKSRSRSNVYDKTKQEDERIAEMEESDEEDLDLDDSDTHLEEEIADIVEEEKKFCRFVGYHPRIEKLCYWVGSDYLKRREQL